MYRKVRVRKNEERIGQDVSAKQREQRNRIRTIQQREDQNLLYSQNFYLFGDAFLGPIFFSVKIGRNFSRGENSQGNSKRFENSVGNCRKRGLIKTIRGRRARFSALFPYLRTSFRRSSVLRQESEKMETLARGGGNEKMIVISWRMAEDIARDNELNEGS